MTMTNGTTTPEKQQDSRYTAENNPDVFRTEEDAIEFSKLVNQEKMKRLGHNLQAGGPGSGRHPDLDRAVKMATDAHKGQVDKSGKPYISHPLRVMDDLKEHGLTAQIAGVLHDVVEDTPVKLHEIEQAFGKEVASAVDSVSRRDTETYKEFVHRSNDHPVGRLVKIADIKDNMRPDRALGRNQESMMKRYNMALGILGVK